MEFVMTEEYDQFQIWLMDMEDAIERFRLSIPADMNERLDFSSDSLNSIEMFILDTYKSANDVKKQREAEKVDGIARYVGQVFHKKFGGKWMIDYSDKNNIFYGLPQLSGMAGQRVQMCPLTLVTASAERRTGQFIRNIFNNYLTRSEQL
jgi:hypothetical protein